MTRRRGVCSGYRTSSFVCRKVLAEQEELVMLTKSLKEQTQTVFSSGEGYIWWIHYKLIKIMCWKQKITFIL